MEALKSFNSQIIETKVLAKMIENESTEDEMSETEEKIDMLKSESIEFVKMSDQSRPG